MRFDLEFDSSHYPYPSRRMVTYAQNGMVATSQSLAAQAGLEILRRGGNAVDAAVATAACLTVVEPTSNGIGSDAFALVWSQGELHGLNSSGPAPKSISIDKVKERGHDSIPRYGWLPVTVPGAPGAWAEIWRKFGELPFEKCLQPAIRYAQEGFPLSPVLGRAWNRAHSYYQERLQGEEFKPWFDTFAPGGNPPQTGEIWRSPDHARTLAEIAETKAESFYRGDLAEKISRFSSQHDGFLSVEDLNDFHPEWVEPIKVDYRGYQVCEIPPNGQGLVALLALNILQGMELGSKDDIDTYHKQIEALKLAFVDGQKYITDPHDMKVRVEDLLSEDYAKTRRELIKERALQPEPGKPPAGGTVYLAAADGKGNMVSFIQSNYMGFGSGLVVPGTGISLQNRGWQFSLDPEDHNSLAPGKRTYHTIIPGFLTKDDHPVGPFGVMGGYMQPQGHLQVISNCVDFGLNPQAALDAPRWRWLEDKRVRLERDIPQHVAQALARRGHQVEYAVGSGGFGRGQIIWRCPETGVLAGGTEPRTDSAIMGW